MKRPILYSLLLIGANIHGCPFTITNDTRHEMFITDGNMHAIHVSPQQSGTINPVVTGKTLGIIPNSWLSKEELHIYRQLQDPNTFYKHYKLSEKYCSDNPEENQFKISDIENLPDSFTKRFHVVTYPMPKEPIVIPSKH